MTAKTTDPSLQSAMASLAAPSLKIAHRLILPGDEHALMPQEAPSFAASIVKVRRASGAARILARELLAQLGLPACPLPRGPSGAPVWPTGIVGSLAHDASVAVAAVAHRRDIGSLGVDIEPAEPLPSEVLELVASPQERSTLSLDPYQGRLLFTAKEAVYKAVHPLDGMFLEHHDVHVDLARSKATVRNGRTVELRFCIATHLVALALVSATA